MTTATCPNCGCPVEDHPNNACVLAALIGVVRDRENLARQHHKVSVLELGEPTYVSETPSGAYVMAWIWVPKPEVVDGDSCTMPLETTPA